MDFRQSFTKKGFYSAIIMSIVVPLISSALPIYDFVTGNIIDYLNPDKINMSSMQVNIKKSKNTFDIKMFLVAFFSVFIGSSIYIIFPYAMLTMKVSLFIGVFSTLLCCFMGGILQILMNFSHFVESCMLLLFIFEKKYIRRLQRSKLTTNRIKSRRVIFIMASALASVSFIYTCFSIGAEIENQRGLIHNGAYYKVEQEITINTWKKIMKDLELKDLINYSYILAPIHRQLNLVVKSRKGIDTIKYKGGWGSNKQPSLKIRSHGGMRENELKLMAISPSHSFLIDPTLQKVIHSDTTTTLQPTGYLYHDKGIGSFFTSDTYRKKFGVYTKSSETLIITTSNSKKDMNIKAETWISSTISIMQGVSLSSMWLIQKKFWNNAIYTSIPVMVHLMQENGPSDYKNLVVDKLMIFLKDKYNNENGRRILLGAFNNIQPYKYGYGSINLYDWENDTNKKQKKHTKIASIVTYFVVVVTTIFSMISLYVTIKANIIAQLKELVILRSLGIRKFEIKKIYIYESMVIVLTATFIGITTGLLVTTVIMTQNSSWAGAVPVYKFPWPLFGVSVGVSLPFCIAYTYYMVSKLLKVQIAKLIRNDINVE